VRPVPADAGNIGLAARLLREGGIVSFPTETVYGLGACVHDARAVARIFEAKERPAFDPLIVHIAKREELELLVRDVPLLAWKLIDQFWPGPLTLVLPKHDTVPEIVTAGLPTVGVRMPAHPVAHALILETGSPVAAPSANPFGYLSPTTAAHVSDQLGDRVDMILDGGPSDVGVESTIVKIEAGALVLLRPGGMPLEEIERVAGMPVSDESAVRNLPEAPGQMESHYSPHTPVRIIKSVAECGETVSRCGLLAFRDPGESGRFARVAVLSPTGDLREAAARLFSALHELDGYGLDEICAQEVPEQGLGRAIMNRLRRASSR
jgi:L-threonylcarbamoyladenylate synthase